MRIDIIEERVKKNRLDDLAGSFYRDNDSQLIESLRKKNKKVYLGIQNEKGAYTVLGDQNVYYSSSDGIENTISNKDFLAILQKNALKLGKGESFKLVRVDKTNSVWVHNSATMCALWNIILLIDKHSR